MAGNSKVGNRGLYEAGDQRHSPQSVAIEARRNRDHPPVSNRRGSHHAKEQLLAKNGSMPTDEELAKHDPTAPVSLFVSMSLSCRARRFALFEGWNVESSCWGGPGRAGVGVEKIPSRL